MKKVLRFIVTLTIMLLIAYRPISIDRPAVMANKPGTYKIGEDTIPEGRYIVTPRDNGRFSSFQIATDTSMDLEYIKDAHAIDEPYRVDLENGDYIKLVNCTAIKEK